MSPIPILTLGRRTGACAASGARQHDSDEAQSAGRYATCRNIRRRGFPFRRERSWAFFRFHAADLRLHRFDFEIARDIWNFDQERNEYAHHDHCCDDHINSSEHLLGKHSLGVLPLRLAFVWLSHLAFHRSHEIASQLPL